MQVSNVSRVATKAAAIEPRVIFVHQTFFPGPDGQIKDGPHPTLLGAGWAAEPKSVSVNGKTYTVSHTASRGRGTALDEYRVFMATLPSGDNPGIVKLANGVGVPVTFRVESAY